MSRTGFAIRPFSQDDLENALELMRVALGESPLLARTPELFDWKHFNNPFGRSLILVAEDAGQVVGLRAFMRWELMTAEGQRLRCVRAVDTATHPDHQRRGIFRALTLEALEMADSEGVDLVFNTPNPQSGAGYLSMGWVKVGEIGVMVRPTPRLLLDHSPSWEVPEELRFSAGVVRSGELAPFDRPARGLRTPRTPEYLAWRFGAHPTARYVLSKLEHGAAVGRLNLRRNRRELVVSDLFGEGAVAALRALQRACGPHYSVAWFPPRSPERRSALRAGLVPMPRVTALTLVVRPLRVLEVDVSSLRNWDLAFSDLELL
jgi:GNAT superfamily N-acetyltransferase